MKFGSMVDQREYELLPGDYSLLVDSIVAIRDFFFAECHTELKSAYQKIEPLFYSQSNEQVDWHSVEYSFNRLFVGPAALDAPPFASYYIHHSADLMTESTLSVRECYSLLGMEPPDKGRVPDDFISYELDALLIMLQIRPLNYSGLKWLVMEHMLNWIPKFCEKCRQAKNVSGPIIHMVDLLNSIVSDLAHSITDYESKRK